MFKKIKKINGGEMSFGMEILIFLVVLFVIWMFMGGAKNNDDANHPFIKQQNPIN